MSVTQQQLDTRQQLLETIEQLRGLIEEHADSAEQTTRLSQPVVDAFIEHGLFRIAVPASLGGLEVDYLTELLVFEAVAQIDGATGWCVFLGGANPTFAQYLPDAGAEEIFRDDPDGVTGGSIFPLQRAEKVDGGYIATGRWPFASGSNHCSWLLGNCMVYEGDQPKASTTGTPEMKTLWFKKSDVTMLDTWQVTGLRGTGSNDFEVNEAFVPNQRAADWNIGASRVSARAGTFIGKHYTGPLFRVPFFCHATVGISAVSLGIARHALDAFSDLALGKKRMGSSRTMSERGLMQGTLAEAEAAVLSARAFVVQTTNEIWDHAVADTRPSLELETQHRLASVDAAQRCAHAVTTLQKVAGGAAIYASQPLERCFRDIHTATQHVGVSNANYEVLGKQFFEVRGPQQ